MGRITALTPQKRNPNRINVFVDGVFVCGVAEVIGLQLKIGQLITAEDISRLQEQDVFELARQSAIRLLENRPRSTAEIRRYLSTKKFEDGVVNQVIEHLQQVELLNDETFADYWVEQRETFRPRSQMALRQELYQKGVGRDVIEEVVSQVDETAAALQAATKQLYRWNNLDERTFRAKLGGFLQRRGFGYEIIQEVTKELWQSAQAGLPDESA